MRSILLVALLIATACGDGADDAAPTTTAGCADVVDVAFADNGDGTYRFTVTVASADTGWEKYADRWEVIGPDGAVLATRVLTHPHVDEQPFTRTHTAEVPDDVGEVTVRAHDSIEGFCGRELVVDLAS